MVFKNCAKFSSRNLQKRMYPEDTVSVPVFPFKNIARAPIPLHLSKAKLSQNFRMKRNYLDHLA